MKFPRSALRPTLATTYSASDLAAVSAIALVISIWAALAGGSFSWLALLAVGAIFLTFYLVGSLIAGCRTLANGVLFDLPLRLLVGYAVVNTALLVLAWLSPLGIIANFCLILAIAGTLTVASRPERKPSQSGRVGFLVVGLALMAATLWCQDSVRPMSEQGDFVLVKPWVDGFYHAVHIRIFGASHGSTSIEDFRLAGVPARLYHYGVYMIPALIKQASGIHSYSAFAGILAPTGVFFTGLAAYAFWGTLWGTWPGFAAAAALLLLPDGAQQGMQNTFMSYHWLTQISPSATYGLALLAVAWLFVMRGCSQGRWAQLVFGWMVAVVLLAYKLHFFIASALLLVLVPPLFFKGSLSLLRRILWASSAIALYAAAIAYGQNIPGVPTIRFDGSCIGKILGLVQSFAERGALRSYLELRTGEDFPWTSNLAFGIPYVLLAALGLCVPLLAILVIRLRKRMPPLELLFPLLLIANFLAMFFGLALDFQRSTPDELSQRPVMVVYFFVVAWLGGASALLLLDSRRFQRMACPAMVGLAILLMAVPAFLGSGVQLMRAMPRISPVRIPVGLVRVAEYMRDNGSTNDIFQDSQFDRTYTVAALSERQAYAARTMTRMPFRSEIVQERADAIEQFMGMREAATVGAKARELGFRWFLLEPGDRVDWPTEVVSQPAFALDGFRLYRF